MVIRTSTASCLSVLTVLLSHFAVSSVIEFSGSLSSPSERYRKNESGNLTVLRVGGIEDISCSFEGSFCCWYQTGNKTSKNWELSNSSDSGIPLPADNEDDDEFMVLRTDAESPRAKGGILWSPVFTLLPEDVVMSVFVYCGKNATLDVNFLSVDSHEFHLHVRDLPCYAEDSWNNLQFRPLYQNLDIKKSVEIQMTLNGRVVYPDSPLAVKNLKLSYATYKTTPSSSTSGSTKHSPMYTGTSSVTRQTSDRPMSSKQTTTLRNFTSVTDIVRSQTSPGEKMATEEFSKSSILHTTVSNKPTSSGESSAPTSPDISPTPKTSETATDGKFTSTEKKSVQTDSSSHSSVLSSVVTPEKQTSPTRLRTLSTKESVPSAETTPTELKFSTSSAVTPPLSASTQGKSKSTTSVVTTNQYTSSVETSTGINTVTLSISGSPMPPTSQTEGRTTTDKSSVSSSAPTPSNATWIVTSKNGTTVVTPARTTTVSASPNVTEKRPISTEKYTVQTNAPSQSSTGTQHKRTLQPVSTSVTSDISSTAGPSTSTKEILTRPATLTSSIASASSTASTETSIVSTSTTKKLTPSKQTSLETSTVAPSSSKDPTSFTSTAVTQTPLPSASESKYSFTTSSLDKTETRSSTEALFSSSLSSKATSVPNESSNVPSTTGHGKNITSSSSSRETTRSSTEPKYTSESVTQSPLPSGSPRRTTKGNGYTYTTSLHTTVSLDPSVPSTTDRQTRQTDAWQTSSFSVIAALLTLATLALILSYVLRRRRRHKYAVRPGASTDSLLPQKDIELVQMKPRTRTFHGKKFP